MTIKFEIGNQYRLAHSKGSWMGLVEVVGFDNIGDPLIKVLKLHTLLPGVVAWFEKRDYHNKPLAINGKADWTLLEGEE